MTRRERWNMSRDHRFVNSFVWDLPRLQKGYKADAILGNWRLSGILTLQAGRPFSVGATNNPMAGAGSARADLVGAGYPVLDPGRSKGERLAAYFDKARFTNPPPGTYGTLSRNILIAPASLLNATHMANPVVGQTNPNFGKITGTAAPRASLQMALKVAC